jgi:hypothetical protein
MTGWGTVIVSEGWPAFQKHVLYEKSGYLKTLHLKADRAPLDLEGHWLNGFPFQRT